MSLSSQTSFGTILRVAYIGKAYYGFQRQPQPNLDTIESKILIALEKVNISPANMEYASRTDRGVNALEQTIFLPDCHADEVHLGQINSFLPKDIRIWAKAQATGDFSPKKNAVAKTYAYTYWSKTPLNMQKMLKATDLLMGTHDFINFAKKDSSKPEMNTIRTINSIKITLSENHHYLFTINGKSFLWEQCRRMVSHLVEIGNEEIDLSYTEKLLLPEKDHSYKPAPFDPNFLVLLHIDYPSVTFSIDKRALLLFKNELFQHIARSFAKANLLYHLTKAIDDTLGDEVSEKGTV